MFFATDHREIIRIENPNAKFGDVGKLLGERWKNADDKMKEVTP